MALNPAFVSSSSRRLPFACGYVFGEGDMVLSTTAADGSQYALYIHGEGEWDGPQLVNTYPNSTGNIPSHMYTLAQFNAASRGPSNILHFHSGAYSTKGVGVIPLSMGPDQQADVWFQQFPSVTPGQCFSGMAYSVWAAPAPSGFTRNNGTWYPSTISGKCVWRTTKCRIFDAYGNVTAYVFTLNPAWHKVEAILRYKIKPQQPGLAGLTAAEKACFNWESIAELAARNDYVLPNGNPRFMGNYIFAADATLTNMLETMHRVDRSFNRVEGGQIYMIGDDPRASIFLMGANHLVPGTLKLSKKNVSKAPNVFVPRYRDLGVPAVSQVSSITSSSSVETDGAYVTVNFTTPSPFLIGDSFYVAESSNAYLNTLYAAVAIGSAPTVQLAGRVDRSANIDATATGGLIGTNDSRFSDRAPTGVQHRSAQLIVAQQAPGLGVQPRITQVAYDCGNSTFDQTNRLMKFERDRTLGTDSGEGWKAPIAGTLSGYPECLDTSGRRLSDVRCHDVISLDDWLTPEFAGDYEVTEISVLAPTETSLGEIQLTLLAYNPNAPTDVSDDPGDAYATVDNPDLPLTGFLPFANAAWALRATPNVTLAGDGTLTITIPDLLIQVMGKPTPTAYPGFSVSGVAESIPVILFVDDPSGIGTSPSYGFQEGTGPLTSPPLGRYVVLASNFEL